jgi:hypothetical protein
MEKMDSAFPIKEQIFNGKKYCYALIKNLQLKT